jgi:hypothetical protein
MLPEESMSPDVVCLLRLSDKSKTVIFSQNKVVHDPVNMTRALPSVLFLATKADPFIYLGSLSLINLALGQAQTGSGASRRLALETGGLRIWRETSELPVTLATLEGKAE